MDHASSARDEATARQREAADPAVSAFVSASAGSGKTKLLTDRLLRLMLGGADPARIQCLTYTTAAAAEMALRLRKDLGGWATGSVADLDASLAGLGLNPTSELRRRARALFAVVLDLPGGMRIETIHAFCQSLLRRFPLEAEISPHFRLLADADANAAMQGAQERMLAGANPASASREERLLARRAAIEQVASVVGLGGFFALAQSLAGGRERLAGLLTLTEDQIAMAQRAALSVTKDVDRLVADAAAWPEEAAIVDALRVIAVQGSPKQSSPPAMARLDWLSGDQASRCAGWDDYAASYFSQKGEPLSRKTLVGDALAKSRPDVWDAICGEVGRVEAVLDACRAARAAGLSAALLTLALPVARGYAETKGGTARLDYGDLIDRTIWLLRDPGAAWVLHKLDGGLDHLLLDEVQDTSPAQWSIAGALVGEFFAGRGARDAARTVFAVGDRKQSIFSFQGAEPAAFDIWRDRLRERVTGAGRGWRDVELNVSFRSTVPVLALVDAVFADPAAARGVAPEGLRHQSDRRGQAGSVELWPLEPKLERTPPPPWNAPHRREKAKGASQRLAESVADWIARAVGGAVDLPSRGRGALPGDILILVRRRDDLARAIVRALKHRGVPVAGLDRMTLTEQPAVADLLALGDALLLPGDDLSVACVLTSPLGGLDDDDLIALAPGRVGALWDELRRRAPERPNWTGAWAFLSTLFARADFVSPHALLAEALGPLGGRARLLARLGSEAAEPIDELLAAALAYGREHPPSLQGFLHWLRRSAAQVKRQPEAAGGSVRLMTVHGAKGLQAPIVILPDTTATPPDRDSLLWTAVDGVDVPIWAPGPEWRSRSVQMLRDGVKARMDEEHNRLLYVALTRAEDRLVVCGHETHRPLPDDCWYRLAERGMALLGTGMRLESAQDLPADRADSRSGIGQVVVLPAWAGAAPFWIPLPLPESKTDPVRLAPSRPRDAALGSVPASASPLSRIGAGRFERGRILHTLLQHLPDLPAVQRAEAARRFLARQEAALDSDAASAALADVLCVLDHPDLADAFGPSSRAEVPLVGLVGSQVVAGLVDRLSVRPEGVLIVDYKTNRQPPRSAEAVPVMYLRQMAAYRAVLAEVHPDRPVRCLLVWTTGALVMALPPDLLDRHAPGVMLTRPA